LAALIAGAFVFQIVVSVKKYKEDNLNTISLLNKTEIKQHAMSKELTDMIDSCQLDKESFSYQTGFNDGVAFMINSSPYKLDMRMIDSITSNLDSVRQHDLKNHLIRLIMKRL
jgi:ABC-type iron transport system FetAB ATPase subunit